MLEEIQKEVNFIWGSNLYANILAFWKMGDYFYFAVGVWANKNQNLDYIDTENGNNICQVIMKFNESNSHIKTIHLD